MTFLQRLVFLFYPNIIMSQNLADLDAAIVAAATTSNDLNISAQNNTSAINNVATRVANLPTGPTDFTSQVNAVNAIKDQLVASKGLIDAAIVTADGIAP